MKRRSWNVKAARGPLPDRCMCDECVRITLLCEAGYCIATDVERNDAENAGIVTHTRVTHRKAYQLVPAWACELRAWCKGALNTGRIVALLKRCNTDTVLRAALLTTVRVMPVAAPMEERRDTVAALLVNR